MTSPEYPAATSPFSESLLDGDPLQIMAAAERHQATDLAPYLDDDFLGQRLSSKSRIMRRYPDSAEYIDLALISDDDESLVEAASILSSRREEAQRPDGPPINALLSHITLIRDIDISKNTIVDPEAPNDRANAIAHLMGYEFVRGVKDEETIDYYVSAHFLLDRMSMLGAKWNNDDTYNYITAKINSIRDALYMRILANNYADTYPGMDDQEPSAQEIAADSAQLQAAFSTIYNDRQYGLKMAYLPHRLGGSLIFGPAISDDIVEQYGDHKNAHRLTMPTEIAADVIHSSKDNFASLRPNVTKTNIDTVHVDYSDIDPIVTMYLGKDGELYADPMCNVSLRDIFVARGKYGAYRAHQAEIIAHYFDLTRPAKVVASPELSLPSPSTPGLESEVVSKPMDAFTRFVVPRVRYVQKVELGIGDEQADSDLEQMQALGDMPPRAREIRVHDVTWHRRPLPEGWSASPEAVARAQKFGITLKPGETFVKDFRRGNPRVGRVAVHRLVEHTVDVPNSTTRQ